MREFSSDHWRAALADRKSPEIPPREARRNIRLLILNGGLMFAGMAFNSPELVLPAFLQTLTTSTVVIGLGGALMRIGWSWPQVFISRIVELQQRKMPVLIAAGIARSACWFLIASLTFWLGVGHPVLLLTGFLLLFAVATSMMGISNVPWMDIIGKSVPAGDRAWMFSLRRLTGGGMAMLSGVLISYVLSERSELAFPSNYAVLFVGTGVLTAVSIMVFGMVREPIEPVRKRQVPLGQYLTNGVGLLKTDLNYRRLCIVQFLWAFSMMGTPFYVPYAIADLGIGTAYVGLFVTVMQFSSVVSNLVWAYVGHRKGSRALLVYGSALMAFSIVVPLLAGSVPSRAIAPLASWGIGTALNLRIAFFSLTFAFYGLATSGMYTGRMSYVLDISPPNRRPTYTSFMNMFSLPQGMLPVVAGVLAAWISYKYMFMVALLFAPISVIAASRLRNEAPAHTR